jgi:hypothetical protein
VSAGEEVESITEKLISNGLPAEGVIGELPQNKRRNLMARFKGGKIRILVTTDDVARGVHVEDISLVVNYRLPQDGETYIAGWPSDPAGARYPSLLKAMPFTLSRSRKSWALKFRSPGPRRTGSKRIRQGRNRPRSRRFLMSPARSPRKRKGMGSPSWQAKKSCSAMSPAGFSDWLFNQKKVPRRNPANPKKEKRGTEVGPERKVPQRNSRQRRSPRRESAESALFLFG